MNKDDKAKMNGLFKETEHIIQTHKEKIKKFPKEYVDYNLGYHEGFIKACEIFIKNLREIFPDR